MKDKTFSIVLAVVVVAAIGGVFTFFGNTTPAESEPEGYLGEPVQYISFEEEMVIEGTVTRFDFSDDEAIVITLEDVENYKEQ